MSGALKPYLREIRKVRDSGKATEHSYRPAFQELIEAIGGSGVAAINDPKHDSEYGAPDFLVLRGGVPVGHIECKDLGANLGASEKSGQLQRYRDALPNLILTDYLEFRWYVDGERRWITRLARRGDQRLAAEHGGSLETEELLNAFFNADAAPIGDAADLAARMAGKTRLLRDHIRGIWQDDQAQSLRELLDNYRSVLIAGLGEEEFADLQAQTVAYGLFAARCLHDGPPRRFTRESAAFAQTTPFLRDAFNRVAGPSADTRITWIIDDLAQLLARADMGAILDDFGKRSGQEDPILHFYEDFLAAYDPELREERGVYYTPEPVVSYIVRSVDHLLREKFGLANGLADTSEIEFEDRSGEIQKSPRVLILDPAAGTGSFLREAVAAVRNDLEARGLFGTWPQYVSSHLLPRLFGFELMMAPYAIAHLQLAVEIGGGLDQLRPPSNDRLNIFLTNSLEEAHEGASGPMFASEIADEASEADAVKRDRPVMVIIGNPPYSGHSANKGKWISDLLRGRIDGSPESYFQVDGAPLGERNPKWLNDDYVKFIRFAQYRIDRTGEGVLGFITNHNYLDAPTFRGMRQSLTSTFDEIYILDLHGNSRKKETAPGNGADENVFDIQQGVAIGIFIKSSGAQHTEKPARVFHADLWGARESGAEGGKYSWLAANEAGTTEWSQLPPKSPWYLFAPIDEEKHDEYMDGWNLPDIFPVNSVGIVTARDKLTIQWTPEDVRNVTAEFAHLPESEARERFNLPNDTRDWKIALAQADLRAHPDADAHVAEVLYRPFDQRFTYYTGQSRGFVCMPRPEVMRHMQVGPNLGLISCRQQSQPGAWSHCGASRNIIESCAISNMTREINYLFPLFTYSREDVIGHGLAERRPNLAPDYIEALERAVELGFEQERIEAVSKFGPEDVFHYIYAVLHSPEYRSR